MITEYLSVAVGAIVGNWVLYNTGCGWFSGAIKNW